MQLSVVAPRLFGDRGVGPRGWCRCRVAVRWWWRGVGGCRGLHGGDLHGGRHVHGGGGGGGWAGGDGACAHVHGAEADAGEDEDANDE